MPERKISYTKAIREAIDQMMEHDQSIFLIGEGVPDPKAIFGTTIGLQEKYGDSRVMDMPLSENAVTGICIGAAIRGMRPIMTHQRLDFSLLALDQIINNAAKWHYMFAGKLSVPLVIRLVIGRGWGQGAQHSQNLQALFAHIPGLKVVMPSTAFDAKGMMIASIKDNNPVIFIEHRWLHNLKDYVSEEMYSVPLGIQKIQKEGRDITVAATSIMTIEALKAAGFLKKYNISIEVVDIRCLKPLDIRLVMNSVDKTRRLLVLDSGYEYYGVASEIISQVCEKKISSLDAPPKKITLPDVPTPSSPGLTRFYYPSQTMIIKNILELLKRDDKNIINRIEQMEKTKLQDVPDESFQGPF